MKTPRYDIIYQDGGLVLIQDVGPWHLHQTVTNGAETVVEELAPMLFGRRLEYYDSGGSRGQLLVQDGRFAGFA